MKKLILFALSLAMFSLFSLQTKAEKQETKSGDTGGAKSVKELKNTAAGCLPGTGFKYLDLNNVRTRINTGGDMWWDFENGKYEIPNGSGKTSMFSAALWMGGVDVNQQLKLAAQMYRYGPDHSGRSDTDFWTGPLTIDGSASIEEETCRQYDHMYEMTREMVDEYIAWWENKDAYPDYTIPEEILNWPAHGDISKNQSFYLAPFFDNNGDGSYDPYSGDYPYYDLSGELCGTKTPTAEEEWGGLIPNSSVLSDQVLKGDQTLWWIFNDKGNIHSNTTGTPIGVEVRAQAFAFSTNDVINNMSFYSYEIINRSTYTLTDTYFSQWVDTDLGDATDDYVGCDVERGLGFCYNGDDVDGDGQPWAYGTNPPAIGVDFFQGPYIDADGEDNAPFDGDCSIFDFNAPAGSANDGSAINGINFGDGIIDNERFGMRRFVYHNNASSGAAGPYQHDPEYAIEYYNYLKGIWRDNSKMIYGGNAHASAGGYQPATECDFMFPGNTDPCNWGTDGTPPNGPVYWTEETANNQIGDRRFMQSAGPFTLEPGAVNYITVGIPWARAQRGGALASVEKLKVADDKCQALFDNCFQVVNGPNAPDLTIRELDKKLIVYITNRFVNNTGNNFQERYEEIDPSITSPDTLSADERYDSTYVFEGYKIYQLVSPDVSPSELDDPDQAQLVFQCDVDNGVGEIINYIYNPDLDADVPTLMVNGADKGIVHTFTLTEDAFSNAPLTNHKQYYFTAVAYGYNNYMTYNPDPEAQTETANFYGQKLPYLEGRKNIQTYTGIPHKNMSDLELQSGYGDGIAVTRIQGVGNSGNYLKVAEGAYDELIAKGVYDTSMTIFDDSYPILRELNYEAGYAPLSIKVVDPLNVKDGEFLVVLDSLIRYQLTNVTGTPNVGEGGDTASVYVADWYLKDLATGEVYKSDTTIIRNNEQLFLDMGISIQLKQTFRPGPAIAGKVQVGESASGTPEYDPLAVNLAENNGFIGGNMYFEDTLTQWLAGVPDNDASPTGLLDWIRSGINKQQDVGTGDLDLSDVSLGPDDMGYAADPRSVFENVIGGTWAPYKLCATTKQIQTGVGYYGKTNGFYHSSDYFSRKLANWEALASVDVVITADSTKWTRCPVLEMSPYPENAEGGAKPFLKRQAPSVNVHGEAGVESSDPLLNSNYIDSVGMGWFPGYAVNVETGERLNMAFGEDSYLYQENGRDMLWNPTPTVYPVVPYPGGGSTFDLENPVLGGKHYVYVFAHDTIAPANIPFGITYAMPPYDAGNSLQEMLDSTQIHPYVNPMVTTPAEFAMAAAMWAWIPLGDTSNWLNNDVKIELRVNKPYDRFNTGISNIEDYTVDGVDLTDGFPVYKFKTDGVAPVVKDKPAVDKDLDLITVVPNPYYGYSEYEENQLDNRIKLVNLPEVCTITIYNVSGTLVRQFKKDNQSTQLDWDLKNFAGIPISGGIYYMHIKAPDKGERVIKWFGALRPIDLNAF